MKYRCLDFGGWVEITILHLVVVLESVDFEYSSPIVTLGMSNRYFRVVTRYRYFGNLLHKS